MNKLSTARTKRIAILGFALESNAFAPVTTKQDFVDCGYFIGDQMFHSGMLRPLLDEQGEGFGAVMSEAGDWQAIPVLFATAGAGGPCDHAFYEEVLSEIELRLQAAMPLDAVYIIGHGAGITTELDDMDGHYFAAVRNIVGKHTPIVATLDLHGNVSKTMVDNADILVAFLTNPHVDMVERSAEAARLINEMLSGMKPAVSFVRLPLVTPQVTQLTGEGNPYGDLILYGQELKTSQIANVSILSGFAFADTCHNGMAIIVTARGDQDAADRMAQELAQQAWAERYRYVPELISLDEATDLARTAGRNKTDDKLILADVADNPGGGGRGNTTWLLESLYEKNAQGVYFGVFFDPPLVEEAFALNEGDSFEARFNREETSEFSRRFTVSAQLVALRDGNFMGQRGTVKDVPVKLGRSCLLRLKGIYIVVISIRQQIFSSETFEHFGLDPGQARSFVVKSRGHFRAGFSHLVDEEHIKEVDVPGLTTPNLAQISWKGLSRPVYPLDRQATWPSQ